MAFLIMRKEYYILWFVEASTGTILDSDIDFLRSLNTEIPKLIIISKADKVLVDELYDIVSEVKNTLNNSDIGFLDVLTDSADYSDDYERDKIMNYLKLWYNAAIHSNFAYNFKLFFIRCK